MTEKLIKMLKRSGINPNPQEETERRLDEIEAQMLYTALMTDTLIEEEAE